MDEKFTVNRFVMRKDENGKDIKVTVPAIRNRKMPVTRYRKRTTEEQEEYEKKLAEHEARQEEPNGPKAAVATQVIQKYTVNVPHREVNGNGDVTVKNKPEPRTRKITVYRGKSETTESISTKAWPLEQVKCFDVRGDLLDDATIKNRLAERQPVILVTSEQGILPYFENLLSPNAMFVITPQD